LAGHFLLPASCRRWRVDVLRRSAGGLEHEWIIFHFFLMVKNPEPIDFHSIIFQDGEISPPTRSSLTMINLD